MVASPRGNPPRKESASAERGGRRARGVEERLWPRDTTGRAFPGNASTSSARVRANRERPRAGRPCHDPRRLRAACLAPGRRALWGSQGSAREFPRHAHPWSDSRMTAPFDSGDLAAYARLVRDTLCASRAAPPAADAIHRLPPATPSARCPPPRWSAGSLLIPAATRSRACTTRASRATMRSPCIRWRAEEGARLPSPRRVRQRRAGGGVRRGSGTARPRARREPPEDDHPRRCRGECTDRFSTASASFRAVACCIGQRWYPSGGGSMLAQLRSVQQTG